MLPDACYPWKALRVGGGAAGDGDVYPEGENLVVCLFYAARTGPNGTELSGPESNRTEPKRNEMKNKPDGNGNRNKTETKPLDTI